MAHAFRFSAAPLMVPPDTHHAGTQRRPHEHCITLDQAEPTHRRHPQARRRTRLRPLAVIVVEPGCKVKAFKKEDGASIIRFEMTFGKSYAALASGAPRTSSRCGPTKSRSSCTTSSARPTTRSSPRAAACKSATTTAKSSARSASPATPRRRDEELAAHGIRAAGLKTDEDCAGLGRRGGVRLTNTSAEYVIAGIGSAI